MGIETSLKAIMHCVKQVRNARRVGDGSDSLFRPGGVEFHRGGARVEQMVLDAVNEALTVREMITAGWRQDLRHRADGRGWLLRRCRVDKNERKGQGLQKGRHRRTANGLEK